jgi:hypothetical protein
VHLVKGLFDVVEAGALGDELLQRQPPLQVKADQCPVFGCVEITGSSPVRSMV